MLIDKEQRKDFDLNELILDFDVEMIEFHHHQQSIAYDDRIYLEYSFSRRISN